jgi:hypothetical protein
MDFDGNSILLEAKLFWEKPLHPDVHAVWLCAVGG